MKSTFIIIIIFLFVGCASNQNLTEEKMVISSTPEQINTPLEIELTKGKYHNHPSFAIWVEDLDGNYIETLYVTKFVAKGVFAHGEVEVGKWKNEPGEVRRPAALPYWSHKRNIKAKDGLYTPSPETAVPDALTGATPTGSFSLKTGTKIASNTKFNVLFEINQPWDSNKYWTNSKFPEDKDYITSLQPALIYSVMVDSGSQRKEFVLELVGHSHPSGKTGEIFTDLSTLTTAKEIVEKIIVRLK
jgi:hypothetical protein